MLHLLLMHAVRSSAFRGFAPPFLAPANQCSEHSHRAAYRKDRAPAKTAAKKPRTADETASESESENEDTGSAEFDADTEASPHPPLP